MAADCLIAPCILSDAPYVRQYSVAGLHIYHYVSEHFCSWILFLQDGQVVLLSFLHSFAI